MASYTAVVKTAKGKGNVELRKVEEPTPKANEVKIEVKAAGICGSDIHIQNDTINIPVKPPVVMGHEFSGVIAGVGKDVEGFSIGERVTSETAAIVCGSCRYCRKGDYNLCSSRRGIGYWVNGAFTKYIVVPRERVHKLPDSLSFEEAALMEPLACCVHEVSERTGISAGDIVLITGPGPIGLLTLQVAIAEGAKTIICGTSRDKSRLKLAKQLGAYLAIDIQKDDIRKIIDEVTDNEGVDVILECSGSESAANLGLELVRKQGKYTQMGGFGKPIQINFDQITYKEIQITGSFTQKWSAWKRAIRLLSEKKVSTKPLITKIFPITEWEEGFKRHKEKSEIKIILTPVD